MQVWDVKLFCLTSKYHCFLSKTMQDVRYNSRTSPAQTITVKITENQTPLFTHLKDFVNIKK